MVAPVDRAAALLLAFLHAHAVCGSSRVVEGVGPVKPRQPSRPFAGDGQGAKSALAMVAGRDELEGVPLVLVISTPFQQMTAPEQIAASAVSGCPRVMRRMARMVMR